MEKLVPQPRMSVSVWFSSFLRCAPDALRLQAPCGGAPSVGACSSRRPLTRGLGACSTGGLRLPLLRFGRGRALHCTPSCASYIQTPVSAVMCCSLSSSFSPISSNNTLHGKGYFLSKPGILRRKIGFLGCLLKKTFLQEWRGKPSTYEVSGGKKSHFFLS